MEVAESHVSFGGTQGVYKHRSEVTDCEMTFAVFAPKAIDMDSYRVEAEATIAIVLPDTDSEIGPVPASGGGRKPESELEVLSNILKTFNKMFGNIDWKDRDRIGEIIAEELPAKVSADKAYQNAMKNSDKQIARIEHDKALERAVIELLSDHTELFK